MPASEAARDGHQLAGMTRSPGKAAALRGLGAEPVVCDVSDASALIAAVTAFGPELVMHQLTGLPDQVERIAEFATRNNRIRTEGTRNLLAARRTVALLDAPSGVVVVTEDQ